MKGQLCAAHCHYVVQKTVSWLRKSGVGVCERALLLNCLMGFHMWTEKWERRVESEFILQKSEKEREKRDIVAFRLPPRFSAT